jgi:hypothetical protein
MRKFSKSLLALALAFAGVLGANSKESIALPGSWGDGCTIEGSTLTYSASWKGAASWIGADWSAYDYVWVKYSGLTGQIRIGLEYDEWVEQQSWGPVFYADYIYIDDAEGIAAIPIEKIKTFVKGSAETDGEHIGEIYAKHVRQLVFQNPVTPSTITIDEIWVGTETEYFTAIGYDFSKNHVLKITNSAAKENIWDNSVSYTFPTALTEGTKYTVTAKICAADVIDGTRIKFVLKGSTAKYGDELAVLANTFTQVSQEFTAGADNTGLEFEFGFASGAVYIDDVSVVAEGSSTNLVANSDFEEPLSTEGWSVPGWTGQTLGHAEQAQGEVALGAQEVTIGIDGWATMVAFRPLSVPTGVDAYFAKYDSDNGNVKLTPVTNMYQWGRAVINGDPGVYYFAGIDAGAVTADGDANGMEISWGSVKGDGSTIYALANKTNGIGFYLVATTVTIPSGKPYLVVPASAPEYLSFTDDVTGINMVHGSELKVNGEYFNLAGQRVANPTKGLYIVNGKKVIIK